MRSAITGLNMRTVPALHAPRNHSAILGLPRKTSNIIDIISSRLLRLPPGLQVSTEIKTSLSCRSASTTGTTRSISSGFPHNDFLVWADSPPISRTELLLLPAARLHPHSYTYRHQKMNPEWHLRSHKKRSLATQPFIINHCSLDSFLYMFMNKKSAVKQVLNPQSLPPYGFLIISDLPADLFSIKPIGTSTILPQIYHGRKSSTMAINKGGIQQIITSQWPQGHMEANAVLDPLVKR